jgi:hypothetical protein
MLDFSCCGSLSSPFDPLSTTVRVSTTKGSFAELSKRSLRRHCGGYGRVLVCLALSTNALQYLILVGDNPRKHE